MQAKNKARNRTESIKKTIKQTCNREVRTKEAMKKSKRIKGHESKKSSTEKWMQLLTSQHESKHVESNYESYQIC